MNCQSARFIELTDSGAELRSAVFCTQPNSKVTYFTYPSVSIHVGDSHHRIPSLVASVGAVWWGGGAAEAPDKREFAFPAGIQTAVVEIR